MTTKNKRETSTGQAPTATCGWWRLVPSSGRARRASTAPMPMLLPPPPLLLITQLLPPIPSAPSFGPLPSAPLAAPPPCPPAMSSSSPPPRPDDDDGAQEVGAGDGRSLGYGEAEYWDARYVEEGGAPYDWYQRYDALRPFVRCFAPPASRILMVGCGSARTQSAPTRFLLVTSNSTHRTISNGNSGRAEFSLLRRCFAFFQ